MKINFLILSILLSLSGVIAQTTEEYHELLNSGNKEQQIKASWELFKHFRLSNRDSALVYAKRNNEIAKEAGDQLALVKSYNALGYIARENGEYFSSVNYYKKGLNVAEREGFEEQQNFLINNIALAYYKNGLFEQSLAYHFKSLEKHAELNDTSGLAMAHNNIAIVFDQLDQRENALKHLYSALELNKRANKSLFSNYINIGLAYLNLENYKEAFKYFKYAEKECNEGCSVALQLDLYTSLAFGYYKINNLDSSMIFTKKALSLAEDHKVYAEILISQLQLSRNYIAMGDFSESLRLLREADGLAWQIDAKKWIIDIQELYVDIHKQTGNYQKALEYYERYTAYKDSLLNKESLQKMADLRTEYEVGQKQAEVDLLTAEKKNQQIIIYAITGGGLLVLLLLGLVFKNNRDKSKINKQLEQQKQQLESLNQTKDKFFSIISHDLRGPISAFAGVSRLIKGAMQHNDKEGLLEVADEIDYSVDHLSGLLDNLLNWAMQQQGHFPNVPEKLEVNNLIKQTVGVFSNMAEGKSISLKVNAPDQLYIWADQNSTMTILRNLLSNALKFTQEGGEVTISSSQIGEMAVIEIADNGLGMSQSAVENLFKLKGRKSAFGTAGEKGLGLGLQLVYEFVEMNNGTIEVESEEGKGTQFTVQSPLFETVSQEVAS